MLRFEAYSNSIYILHKDCVFSCFEKNEKLEEKKTVRSQTGFIESGIFPYINIQIQQIIRTEE